MAKINVKAEKVKISNVKTYNCKNGKTLTKFGICIGKYKDDDSFKFVNCLYWGNKTLVNKDVISFEGTLDLSHFTTKEGIKLNNVDITIDNLVAESKVEEVNDILKQNEPSWNDTGEYTMNNQLLQEIHEEQKAEDKDDTLAWFEEEGEK